MYTPLKKQSCTTKGRLYQRGSKLIQDQWVLDQANC